MPEGRVPLEDIFHWLKVLQESPKPFSEEELNRFLDDHVIENLYQFKKSGMSEERCVKEIISGIEAAGIVLHEDLKEYFREKVHGVYAGEEEN